MITVPDLVETVVKITFIFGLTIGFFAPVLGWIERKQSAVMQDRIGGNRAAILGFTVIGLFHSLADAIKLIFKEDFVPRGAETALHRLAPVISVVPALIAFAVIPFGGTYNLWGHETHLVIADLDVGVLYVFAIASLATYGVVIAGWASNNNWSLLGALRAAAQMFSYEVAMGLTIIGLVMFYQSLSLVEIVDKQENFYHWGIIWHFPAFILFLTCAIAENKRIPFDTPEAESELVAGYFTEYSGMKFIMFWTAEFLEIVTISALCVTLFFGGHQIPFLTVSGLIDFLGFLGPNGSQVAAMLIGVAVFIIKLTLLIMLQMSIRWTLPRFRYDQIMKLGWKMILPASLIWIFLVGVGILTGVMPAV
ncbi:NADH-ubiquinone oxidoreductase chain H [hydrothermal vent metagenome]|uniref:NADH-ubiquinone oxidoreductase chain H n=1 Tax=hydrothermal vent metagenome TaxID=652676 RepID=A0A3B1CCS5_9ZZZZ